MPAIPRPQGKRTREPRCNQRRQPEAAWSGGRSHDVDRTGGEVSGAERTLSYYTSHAVIRQSPRLPEMAHFLRAIGYG